MVIGESHWNTPEKWLKGLLCLSYARSCDAFIGSLTGSVLLEPPPWTTTKFQQLDKTKQSYSSALLILLHWIPFKETSHSLFAILINRYGSPMQKVNLVAQFVTELNFVVAYENWLVEGCTNLFFLKKALQFEFANINLCVPLFTRERKVHNFPINPFWNEHAADICPQPRRFRRC